MENLVLRLLPSGKLPVLVRYGFTTLIVVLTLLLRVGLDGVLQQSPFLLFIPAVFLSALIFDRGSGYWATALSASLVLWLLNRAAPGALRYEHIIPLLLFIAISVAITVITESLRVALERVSDSARKLAVLHAQKDLLLREMAHRTRNNLQTMTAVLKLQGKAQANTAVQVALADAADRIQVIARAHEQLVHADSHGIINMKSYLEELCQSLGDAMRGPRPIALRVDAEPIELNAALAVPIGLLANELVTNAFKHAFPDDRSGAVDVCLRRASRSEVELIVADDGVGCPDESVGLGMRLMKLLVGQLKGSLSRKPGEPGCCVVVRLQIGDLEQEPMPYTALMPDATIRTSRSG